MAYFYSKELNFGLLVTSGSLFLGGIPMLASPGEEKYEDNVRPNILFIIADDLGKGDIACYGNDIVKTPAIDHLAEEGIRLDKYRSAAPISGPSRVAVMTGRHHERSGFRMSHSEKTSSLDEPWIARQLRNGGYSTAIFGKAHLGDTNYKGRGFDHWVITSPGGWADYYSYHVLRTNEKRKASDGTYATDFITDEVLKFIESNHHSDDRRPFYAYVGYTAPHFPLQVPEEEIEPYKGKGLAEGTEILYGMITRMDRCIGRIVDKLKELDEYDNTIIVFVSDNGPVLGSYMGLSEQRWNCNLAGQKEYVLEGGINVPGIIQWPAMLSKRHSISDLPITGLDWAPTFLEAAGIKPEGKPFDGISVLPVLLDDTKTISFPPRMWCYNKAYMTDISNAAMIDGDWKLYRPHIDDLNRWDNKGKVPSVKPSEWQLFNLSSDPFETTDLSASEGKRVKKMKAKFTKWWKSVYKENVEISGPDINQ